jgi:hypothetical protein
MPARKRKKAKPVAKVPTVQWIGNPDTLPGGALEYPGAKFGDESYAPGDFVLLKNPDGDGQPFVARIEALLQ